MYFSICAAESRHIICTAWGDDDDSEDPNTSMSNLPLDNHQTTILIIFYQSFWWAFTWSLSSTPMPCEIFWSNIANISDQFKLLIVKKIMNKSNAGFYFDFTFRMLRVSGDIKQSLGYNLNGTRRHGLYLGVSNYPNIKESVSHISYFSNFDTFAFSFIITEGTSGI